MPAGPDTGRVPTLQLCYWETSGLPLTGLSEGETKEGVSARALFKQ